MTIGTVGRWTGVLVVIMVLSSLALASALTLASGQSPRLLLRVLVFYSGFGTFGIVGGFIVWRIPTHRVGWVLCGIGLAGTLGGVAGELARYLSITGRASSAWTALAAWWGSVWFFPAFTLVLVFLPLLFPTGHLLSPRWRIIAWAGALLAGLGLSLASLSESFQTDLFTIPNPIGIEGMSFEEPRGALAVLAGVTQLALSAVVLSAFASLIARFRRSRTDQRQQVKWFTYAGALLVTMFLVASTFFPDLAYGEVIFGVAVALIPISIGIAILRYRLYDIDLVINRTLVYGALTASLGAVYVAGVVGLPRLLPLAEDNDLVVAGSTLAVAALFSPLRRRVQAFVDRRFYRSRYDVRRTLEEFSSRLRDQVDLEALVGELQGVVGDTVAPATVGVWLRDGRVNR